MTAKIDSKNVSNKEKQNWSSSMNLDKIKKVINAKAFILHFSVLIFIYAYMIVQIWKFVHKFYLRVNKYNVSILMVSIKISYSKFKVFCAQ